MLQLMRPAAPQMQWLHTHAACMGLNNCRAAADVREDGSAGQGQAAREELCDDAEEDQGPQGDPRVPAHPLHVNHLAPR
jgi:hypothetical protein